MKKTILITLALTTLMLTSISNIAKASEFKAIKGANLTKSVKTFAKDFPLGLTAEQMVSELGMPRDHKTAFGMETATYKFGQASAIEFYINKEGIIFDCMAYPQDPKTQGNATAKGTMSLFSTFNKNAKSIWNAEPVKCSEF